MRFLHLSANPHQRPRKPSKHETKEGGGAAPLAPCCEVQNKLTSHFFFTFKPFPAFPFASPLLRPPLIFASGEYSWNGAHHELLLASPGRRIDIIKKPIKLRAGAFITVICEGLGLMGCLFPCVGLTAAIVYCWNDAHPPPHTTTSISYTPEGNKKPNLTYGSRTHDVTSNVQWLILRTTSLRTRRS